VVTSTKARRTPCSLRVVTASQGNKGTFPYSIPLLPSGHLYFYLFFLSAMVFSDPLFFLRDACMVVSTWSCPAVCVRAQSSCMCSLPRARLHRKDPTKTRRPRPRRCYDIGYTEAKYYLQLNILRLQFLSYTCSPYFCLLFRPSPRHARGLVLANT
jgi:hypothetical protein